MDMKISLEAARTNAKMTQKDSADALGVTVQTISTWEKDPAKIPVGKAYLLAELYNMPLDNIIFLP